MKNLFVFCLFALIASACTSNEEIVPQSNLQNANSGPGGFNGCLIGYTTNPADGNCPADYQFQLGAPGICTNYSWSVSGDAHFNSGTTSSTSSVIVERSTGNGSFTISATAICNGVSRSCSRTFVVLAEGACQ